MMAKDNQKNTNRGLASASDETRTRVAREGGKAPHDERGLQATDDETRARVAREGGKASHSGGRRRSWMNSKKEREKEREHHDIQLIILNLIFTLHKQPI